MNSINTSSNIYVSYAWKVEEQKQIVDKLEQACQHQGMSLLRDKQELNYKDSIRQDMEKLTSGDAIILVLSEPYFKSAYCMYELCLAHQRNDFYQSIFPVTVGDTPLHEPEDRIDYLIYWEAKCNTLEQKLSKLGRNYTKNLNETLDEYAEYRRLIDEILAVLADMNTLVEGIHLESNFEQLLEVIQGKTDQKQSKVAQVEI